MNFFYKQQYVFDIYSCTLLNTFVLNKGQNIVCKRVEYMLHVEVKKSTLTSLPSHW